MNTPGLPLRHLSVRVPWHDTAYDGRICTDPLANGACLRLLRIAEQRDDRREVELAGSLWSDLPRADLPPCSVERAGFMATTARSITKNHPYAEWNDRYKKFRPTTYELPAFSADCVPFRWMLRDNAAAIADQYAIDYEPALETAVDTEASLNSPAWVQHATNQRALLDTFFSAVQPEKSLIFLYAKESPLSTDPRRVLIGVGRVAAVDEVIPYDQVGDGFGSVLWERVVRHTIRPDMVDGFLLPYQELLRQAAEDDVDPGDVAVFVPDEFTDQFSYASEHVDHDAALSLLLELDRTVERLSSRVAGNWSAVRSWLSERVAEVWEARGPCPGLGAALTAFGIPEGTLLAFAVQGQLPDNADPWPLVDSWLRDPSLDSQSAARIARPLSQMWVKIPEDRRELLRLLSRFSLTTEQATRLYQQTERDKAGIDVTDRELLANPYLVYERGRLAADPVAVGTVDRGVFPDDRIRVAHPLPKAARIDGELDPRRARALIISALETAAVDGHALQPQATVIQSIRDAPLQPGCPLSNDAMSVVAEHLFPEVVVTALANDEPALQLSRQAEVKRAIARMVDKRAAGKPLPVTADWQVAIDKAIDAGKAQVEDQEEAMARQEKAAALAALATSRISVLIGAAGTGKTTLLRALCSLEEVRSGGLLLLAPTGKARVRMQEAIGTQAGAQALTIAQLLVGRGRYDHTTNRYRRSDQDRYGEARTVIVDECSMLTEDALDALLDGIEGYDRLVLVGDHRQLPPIGVGRPFVDIVNRLRETAGELTFPRVGGSYAELTIPRRQVSNDADDRADLQLAEWFSGGETSPGTDEIWDRLRRGEQLKTVSLVKWESTAELHGLLRQALVAGLSSMKDADDVGGFEESYGGSRVGDFTYFNLGAAGRAEDWQVLSPVRGSGGGVNELNRLLQRTYRESVRRLALSGGWQRKVPKPAGPQEVLYGDKVINVRNGNRRHYYPKKAGVLEYVANGEIGVVTGPFQGRGTRVPLNRLEVEFATQRGTAYKYWLGEMGGDEGTPPLEIAYAITIHKAQGSEFGRTFVVVPSPCRLLSRELLYTALTRQREHVTVLHQGDVSELQKYSRASFSESAARITNLFNAPEPVEVEGRYLEAGLIHRTRKGISVRSKSEVIIADLLYAKGVEFEYEKELEIGGERKLPDFTIVDTDSGVTYYWEHLGMLQRPSYRRKWDEKKKWYEAHGISSDSEGGGEAGTLIVTSDDESGGISSQDIEALIDNLLA